MPNYLNQIESDLYKLNSITNGSGEVVEMVAELKEKYEKAEAFDLLKNNIGEEVKVLTDNVSGFPYVDAPIESAISHLEHVLRRIKKLESGEYDAKK